MLRERGWGDIGAATLCALFGVVLSALPHLVWWLETGDAAWIADNDDLLYLSIAGRAYLNHPLELRDPATGGATIYPWLQFIPGVLIAKGLGLGPLGINLIWRIWAGVSIGLAWYLFTRHFIRARVLALLASLVLLADVGVLYGKPLFRQVTVAAQLLTGRGDAILAANPQIHLHWRIITPGLSLAFLLAHIWLVARARDEDRWLNRVLAGLGFGFLFYTYFYYWTAAGLALALAFLLDAKRRAVYFHTAWIGGVVGLPSVVSGFLLKESSGTDWQHRTDNFLPIARFSELLLPKGVIILLALSFFWVWMRRRELLYLWALGAAAILLENHQVITGLQIQNFHWSYVWGSALSALLVLIGVDAIQSHASRSRAAVAALSVLVAIHLVTGVVLRRVEAERTRESVLLTTAYHRYSEQREARAPLEPNVAIGGDQLFVDLAAALESQRPLEHYSVTLSPQVDDAEWNARTALNGYLRGVDRERFAAEQDSLLIARHWGPWGREAGARRAKVGALLAAYDAVVVDPKSSLDRFGMRYVALPAGQPRPGYLESTWVPVQDGPHWSLWRRGDAESPAPSRPRAP